MSVKRRLDQRYSQQRTRSVTRSFAPTSQSGILSTAGASEPPEDDPQDDEENQDGVVMAVEIGEGMAVGCAYYVAKEEKLYMMEDMKLGGLEVLESLKLFIEPTAILCSAKNDESVIAVFQSPEDDNESQIFQPFSLQVRPSSEFGYNGAKQKLASLNIIPEHAPTMTLGIGHDGGLDVEDIRAGTLNGDTNYRFISLSTWVDVQSRSTVGCAGAIISYLQRRRSVRSFSGNHNENLIFGVKKLETFTLDGFMMISGSTLSALQIMSTETHPNVHTQGPSRQSSGAKEGLSVYGLFQGFARSPQGKTRLRQYFLRPSIDPRTIEQRLDAVDLLRRPINTTIAMEISKCLSKIKNMRATMRQLRQGDQSAPFNGWNMGKGVWPNLHKFCFQILKLREFLIELNGHEHLWIYNTLIETINVTVFTAVGQDISHVIDFEETASARRITVNRGVDIALDERKRQYDGLNDLLATATERLADLIEEALPSLNTIYFPQIGFLIAVPIDPRTGRGVIEQTSADREPWTLKFTGQDAAYYKSPEMAAMDIQFGDIQSDICDREIEIILELAQRTLLQENVFVDASDICGELDCLLALAKGAEYYNLSRPVTSRNNIINIQNGRHILYEQTVSSFVANDTFLVGDAVDGDAFGTSTERSFGTEHDSPRHGPSMLIMTGPNYSGKSVYLKQTALIVYLMHIGSFVPAESAEIGIIDKLLTRITTKDTVSKQRSTFMIDLQQMFQALSLATPRSLLIIDEFGKGTNPCDGAGLACGAFEHLLGLGQDCPKVLATTHFHEMFEFDYLAPQPRLAFGHMEVFISEEHVELDEQVTYLYKFQPGRSNESWGTLCAKLNGIDQSIIDRANELSELARKGEDLVAACSQIGKSDAEALNRAEKIARRFLLQDIPDPEDPNDDVFDGLEDLLATIFQD